MNTFAVYRYNFPYEIIGTGQKQSTNNDTDFGFSSVNSFYLILFIFCSSKTSAADFSGKKKTIVQFNFTSLINYFHLIICLRTPGVFVVNLINLTVNNLTNHPYS